ncbi:MAG TPA: site-specific integrase [Flavobacterium sp.]|uniref:site-specific integrase n=1 Tax=Flavobacterium sp. TaxID=239 RepID=UPI002DBE8CCC|nr:site-specific integrase [Flavobacterium sp.]HEU4790076.1 site-specific integrase [Flavobacterium sp.]
MYSFSKDGITIATMLDDRKANKKGSFPVKIRVTYKRDRKYYSTGKDLTPEEWKVLPTGKSRLLKETRESIENSFSLVKSNVEAIAEKGGFSLDTLNNRLGRGVGDTINSSLKVRIENLKSDEKISTMQLSEYLLKSLEKFSSSAIDFENITVDWLKKYEKHLLNNDKSYTTISMQMRVIRTLVNQAKRDGIIKETQYPFGKDKYEIKEGVNIKKALTLDQIKKIFYFTDGNETTERYRDLWIFSYLCNGINIADLVKLKFKDIKDGDICFVRQKTESTSKNRREIRASVTVNVQNIIDRWGNKPKPENYIFPYLNGKENAEKRQAITKDLTKRINLRMKKIGEELKIGDITTYTARHSFATVLKRSGANIASISESLGHNDLKTTESYLASFEKEERQKNAQMLTDF